VELKTALPLKMAFFLHDGDGHTLDHYICSFSLLTQTITLMHCLLFSYSKLWCLDNITTDILMCYLNEIPWLFEHGALDAADPSDVLSMETRRSFPDARCGGSTSNASSAAREAAAAASGRALGGLRRCRILAWLAAATSRLSNAFPVVTVCFR
jgi:hypothetical protein